MGKLAKVEPEDKLSIERYDKIKNLDALIDRKEELSTQEYRGLLHEVQKNYMAKLTEASLNNSLKGSGACMAVIEKIHWLIDSIDKKYGNIAEKKTISFENFSVDEILVFKAMLIRLKGPKEGK